MPDDGTPPVPADLHRVLVDHLLEHSVRRGEFTLKSGKPTGWFIDSKQTACDPAAVVAMADAALAVIPEGVDAIGGLTMGADPVAYAVAAIAAVRGRPMRSFSIRKEAKDHGVEGRLAGALRPGDRVVITEDTATRGTSMLDSVEAVRALGGEVVLGLALVDRGGTATGILGDAGVPFRALVTAPDLGFPFERDVPG